MQNIDLSLPNYWWEWRDLKFLSILQENKNSNDFLKSCGSDFHKSPEFSRIGNDPFHSAKRKHLTNPLKFTRLLLILKVNINSTFIIVMPWKSAVCIDASRPEPGEIRESQTGLRTFQFNDLWKISSLSLQKITDVLLFLRLLGCLPSSIQRFNLVPCLTWLQRLIRERTLFTSRKCV